MPAAGLLATILLVLGVSAQQSNIREVTAFPKTQSGSDPMLEAPSLPEPGQYEELGLRFVGVSGKG